MKTMVYIGSQDIKNNGISDWLKKESMQLVVHSLLLQVRKLPTIDKLFLVKREGSRDSIKVALSIAR